MKRLIVAVMLVIALSTGNVYASDTVTPGKPITDSSWIDHALKYWHGLFFRSR